MVLSRKFLTMIAGFEAEIVLTLFFCLKLSFLNKFSKKQHYCNSLGPGDSALGSFSSKNVIFVNYEIDYVSKPVSRA